MTESLLSCEVVQAKNHSRSIIWMHGLGADGYNFIPLAHELNFPDVRWVFPHAPTRAITLNQGMVMRGWYDIYFLDRLTQEDAEGLNDSRSKIWALIDQEIAKGIAPENIYLGGFSQGGVMAFYAGLSHPQTLGGIIALSCYLPLNQTFDEWRAKANQDTEIFFAHGHQDLVLPMGLAQMSLHALKSRDYKVQWHDYQMAHEVCAAEVSALRGFFT